MAEIILDSPLFLAFGDKLILRSGDTKTLIAGARVLEINSPKRHKRTEVRLNFLANLALAENASQRIALTLQHNATTARQLMWTEQLTSSQLGKALAERDAVRYQDWCFNANYVQEKRSKF